MEARKPTSRAIMHLTKEYEAFDSSHSNNALALQPQIPYESDRSQRTRNSCGTVSDNLTRLTHARQLIVY
jgi:hypothetical protein